MAGETTRALGETVARLTTALASALILGSCAMQLEPTDPKLAAIQNHCAAFPEARSSDAPLVINHFIRRGAAAPETTFDGLSPRQKNRVCQWTDGWKSGFLIGLSDEELGLLWRKTPMLLADNPRGYFDLGARNRAKLARIGPSVEANVPSRHVFRTQRDVERAIARGRLAKGVFRHFAARKDYFFRPDFLRSLKRLDAGSKPAAGIFEVSSAERPLNYQKLLRKLGYPAAVKSYHSAGLAMDLRMSADAKKRWAAYLAEVAPDAGGLTRLQRATVLEQSGTHATIDALLSAGIVSENNEIVMAFLAIKRAGAANALQVVDETAAWAGFDEETGDVTRLNIILHIQPLRPRFR